MHPKNTGRFTNLPNHRTPPSGLTKFVARNPFESDLTNRLHKSVISPSVFKKVTTDPQNSPEFSWSVEELALIKPAKIEEFPVEQIYNVDPDVELKAQEAIDKFFMTNEIVPSPWESKKKEHKIDIKLNTPKRLIDKSNKLKDFPKMIKKDGACQTTLSLPSILPENVEEALKPYFTFNKNIDNDDANLSTNSLRRKLFFNLTECTDDEEQSSFLVSPIKINLSSMFCKSPPESGMFYNGSPLKKCSRKMQRYGTPIQFSENLSPNISSIPDIQDTSVDDIKKTRSRPVMKLNFCQSMEMSTSESIEVSENNEVSDNLTINEENSNKSNNDHENTKTDITVEMNSVVVNSTSLIKDNEKNKIVKDKEDYYNNVKEIKNFPDFSQVYKLENCTSQQTNIFWGMSEKQSASNIVQDTGYQTFSMNSTTNLTDSSSAKQKFYNNDSSSTKQKFYNNEQFLLFDDEIPLSDWKENFRNVACSTPSKCNVNEKE
ncbi:PREDICTED: protein aurora borealis [Polistes canadensis]|uniref:protein aurora borealis n=1 Tax=Polistes canadensis TaxID=91411 RepID=UPI000718F47D|nr:PREDICTED: protein aurora borealis [Polistes canadensis]